MKRELFAAALLAALMVLSLLNTAAITGLTDDLTELVEQAGDAARRGDWAASESSVESAMDLWRRHTLYTHVVLRHNDIETLSDDIYELQEHICTRDAGAVRSAVGLVREHLRGIRDMESINLGSIF